MVGTDLKAMTSCNTREMLAERAIPGLHAALLDFVEARFAKECLILDVGCGTGAWVERLRSNGFRYIWAVDQDRRYYAGAAPFAEVDLNTDFPHAIRGAFSQSSFDLITAVEVVEHLESLAQFLRHCHCLLPPGGCLVITTPNVGCAPGRLKFALKGELRHFDEHGDPTHITPVIPRLLKRLAERTDFAVEFVSAIPPGHDFRGTSVYKAALAHFLCGFAQGETEGDCTVFLLRRK